MPQRSRCSVFERLSKKTLLALVKAPSVIPVTVGERVQYTDANGRTGRYRVAAVGSGGITLEVNGDLLVVQRSQIKTNDPPFLLDNIPEENWHITSFDSKTRVACVTIQDEAGTRTLSITVPAVRPTNP
jgi:hypothetical protein